MKRSEINNKYKWDLSHIYKTDELWEQDFKRLKEILPSFQDLKQNMTDSAKNLANVLRKQDEALLLRDKLTFYAQAHRDEDNTNTKYQAMTDRAQSISAEASEYTSFIAPALLKENAETLERYTMEEPELKDYKFFIKNIIRKKKYVLSESEEKILSMSEDFAQGAEYVYDMLCEADMQHGSVVKDGKEIKLTHSKFIDLMQDKDRKLRKEVFEKFYKSFRDSINTISTTFSTSIKKDVFYSKVRGYENSLSSSLFEDNVPVALYDKLINTVHDNLGAMHEYVKTKRKVLGLSEIKMYDIYVPLTNESNRKYSYEQAMDLVIEALQPMGKEYISLLERARDERWIDVYESEARSSGAYSWGPYDIHPYVFLNHMDDLDSAYTIAHELGHAMNTYYSNKNQPYATSEYAMFGSEVASTVNEVMLTLYLLDTTAGEFRKYVLNQYLEGFRTIVFRQTMFAEFEKNTHAMCEAGTPLTKESISKLYAQLNQAYHGDVMQTCDIISLEWARIPHFYMSYYVYAYAIGFSAAVMIANGIYQQKPGALEAYKEFLKSGGSDYPLELLKKAGVDFIDGNPIENCMETFVEVLNEFKREMGV